MIKLVDADEKCHFVICAAKVRCLPYSGLFKVIKVNQKKVISRFDLENEISVCVRNWELKTWVLKPRFENPDSWLLSKKAIIN